MLRFSVSASRTGPCRAKGVSNSSLVLEEASESSVKGPTLMSGPLLSVLPCWELVSHGQQGNQKYKIPKETEKETEKNKTKKIKKRNKG